MSCPFPPQQADPKERYAISELLTDLESCNARRVLLFLDQSYPGPLVKKLQASQRHPNVVLVHSTTALRSGSAFAEFWAGLQPDQCLLQHTLPVSVLRTLIGYKNVRSLIFCTICYLSLLNRGSLIMHSMCSEKLSSFRRFSLNPKQNVKPPK